MPAVAHRLLKLPSTTKRRVLVAVATLKLIHKIVIRFSGVGFGAKTVASVSLALIL